MPEDLELWKLYGNRVDVRAILREIHDAGQPWGRTLIGLEVRIEQGGELRQSQRFRNRKALGKRSQAIHETLVSKGWRAVQ